MILDSRIVDDVEHMSVVFASKSDIIDWEAHVRRTGDSYRYIPESWKPKELFGKLYAEIVEFIEGRFRDTSNIQEYYACMLFLKYTVPEDELYVLWKDSPNYRALQAQQSTQNDQEGINTLPNQMGRIQRDAGRYRTMLKYRTGRAKHGRV